MTQPKRSHRSFPALRCRMGDWTYYVTALSFADVAKWVVTPTSEVHHSQRLSEWIQRQIRGGHLRGIIDYLRTQPERFFNALVLGVYKGEPSWVEIDVSERRALDQFEVSPSDFKESKGRFGYLQLAGTEKIFAVDGQHRAAAIKAAIQKSPNLGKDYVTAIMIGHKDSAKGRARTRRLFTTLNKTARRVNTAEIIALDEDNGGAVVTRRLVEDFRLLRLGEVVAFGAQASIPESDRTSFTSIIALYNIVIDLASAVKGVDSKKIKSTTDSDIVNRVEAVVRDFFEALVTSVEECDMVLGRHREISGKFRAKGSNHLLFRPVGQRAFAKATQWLVVNEGIGVHQAVARLSLVPMYLEVAPWTDILWDTRRQIMLTRDANRTLAEAVLLESVGVTLPVAYASRLRKYRAQLASGPLEG